MNATSLRLMVMGLLGVVLGIGLYDFRMAIIVGGALLVGGGVLMLDVGDKQPDRTKQGSRAP